ncbi:alpha/beta hydrolase [Paenibacillaceae bacterium]|nr:alpha/beta hydrolase [Paenibacillaceae bacterium]
MEHTENKTLSGNPMHFQTVEKEKEYNAAYDRSLTLWNVPITTSYVPTRFGSAHIISCGPEDGEPLVLLHAMGFSSTIWYPNIEQLAQKFKVYAVDYIGDLNKSIPATLPENRAHCAEWLDDVLHALKIEQCCLGGISYGGFLAINYAVHHAHRVKKMFLLSPAASFAPLYQTFIDHIIAMAALPTRENVQQFIQWLSKHSLNQVIIDQFYYAFKCGSLSLKVPPGEFSDDDFKKLAMPILLLLGDQEVISDADLAFSRANQVCSNLIAEIISGTGHLLNLENPEGVNEKINAFL